MCSGHRVPGWGRSSASCASISGVNIGSGCTSGLSSVAVGLGPNTYATSIGVFNTAITRSAKILPPRKLLAGAVGGGFNVALASGKDAVAVSGQGVFNIAATVGDTSAASATGFANVALNAGNYG